MAELQHLDSPMMNEEQATNLITKLFSTSIRAHLQTTDKRQFLPIQGILGELETNESPYYKEETVKHDENTSKQTNTRQNNT